MLHITDSAVGVLRAVLQAAPAETRGGLRLVTNNDTPGEPGIQMSLIARPEPGDLVAAVEPLVYLAADAVAALADQTLDAQAPHDPTSLRIIPRAA